MLQKKMTLQSVYNIYMLVILVLKSFTCSIYIQDDYGWVLPRSAVAPGPAEARAPELETPGLGAGTKRRFGNGNLHGIGIKWDFNGILMAF